MPPHRFNLLYKDYYDRLGIHFGFHVGIATDARSNIDVDGARTILDRVAGRQLDRQLPVEARAMTVSPNSVIVSGGAKSQNQV